MLFRKFTIIVLLSSVIYAGDLVTVNLPKGVSVSIPSDWVVLSDSRLQNIEQYVARSLPGTSESHLEFGADLLDSNKQSLALFNIRYYPSMVSSQEEMLQFSDSDIRELDSMLSTSLTHQIKATGCAIISWNGTIRTRINNRTAFLTSYQRSVINSSLRRNVYLVRYFNEEKSFTITISYLSSHSALLHPVYAKILNSIRF